MFVPQKTTTNTKENHGNSKMCATICGLKMRSCAFDRFKIVAFLFNFPQFLVIQNEKSTLEKQKKKELNEIKFNPSMAKNILYSLYA